MSWLLSPFGTVPAWCQFKLSTPATISRVHARGGSTFLGMQNPPCAPFGENPDLETLFQLGTAQIEMQKPLFHDRRLQRGTNTLIIQHACYIALSTPFSAHGQLSEYRLPCHPWAGRSLEGFYVDAGCAAACSHCGWGPLVKGVLLLWVRIRCLIVAGVGLIKRDLSSHRGA